jgi:hypothetical protein
MFYLRSILLSTLFLASLGASEPQTPNHLARRQDPTTCEILMLPYSAGDTLCGLGIVISGCICCYDTFACNTLVQSCGVAGCINNPGYFPTGGSSGGSCPSGMKACGTGCIAASNVCCGSSGSFCSAGYVCDNASNGCVTDNTGSASEGTTKAATATATGGGTGASQAAVQSGGGTAVGGRAGAAWKLLAVGGALLLFA